MFLYLKNEIIINTIQKKGLIMKKCRQQVGLKKNVIFFTKMKNFAKLVYTIVRLPLQSATPAH
jgi:hypothetical protein